VPGVFVREAGAGIPGPDDRVGGGRAGSSDEHDSVSDYVYVYVHVHVHDHVHVGNCRVYVYVDVYVVVIVVADAVVFA
jgi:hypothetical protein